MKKLAAALVALAAFATACSGNVFSLSVGDCFNDPDDLDQVSSVETASCDEPHDNEVYLLFDIAGDTYPGREAVSDQAVDGCLDGFDPYVGRDFQTSAFDISFLTPSEDSWSSGDREVVCFLFAFEGGQLDAPAKDSGL